MANKSIFDAFERMWQHTVAKLGLKADKAEIQETYETKAAAGDKLAEAKTYADEAAAAVKNDLLNGAGEAYDTLKELGDLINENQDALEALETVATGKAEKEHIHAISDVAELQGALDNALVKTAQTLTDDELGQVRANLKFIGKNVEGQQFTIDGQTVTAAASAEIFGDYDTNIATGQWSIAEGSGTVAKGRASHAEGAFSKALMDGSHVEGYQTEATGYWSHAEGEMTKVTSYASHAEGSYCTMPDGSKRYTTASGYASHAEGGGTLTSGSCAHAEGLATTASGNQAHAEGRYTIAAGGAQHVEGVGNIEDAEGEYIHIAGNGSFENRNNAHTLDWDGNANFAGDVYVGNANENKAGKKLATEEYVNESSKKLVFDSIQLRDISTGLTYLLQIKDGIIVTSSKVTGISMTTQPNKTTYMVGETVDLTGIVIEATCENGSVKDVVASDVTYYPEVITEGVTSIEVKYHSGGSEYIATVPIRVVASIEELLIDFGYTDNDDGTYTLIRWKQTLNGEPSTEMVIPDNSSIKL